MDELKGIGRGGGGFTPKGFRAPLPTRAGREPSGPFPDGGRQGDSAQLRDQTRTVRDQAERLESLQRQLASLAAGDPALEGLRGQVAQAQVTMANLLGAAGPEPAGPGRDLASALQSIRKGASPAPERVLDLLAEGGCP